MKLVTRYSLLFSLLLSCSLLSFAQGVETTPKSAPSITTSETFTSSDGRFSIALPQQFSGYSPKSVNTPGGRIESVLYNWQTAAGVFTVGYVDRPEKTLETASKDVLDAIRNSILNGSNGKAKLTTETEMTLAGHPGRELRLEFPDSSTIARIYIVGNRLYEEIASISTAKKTQEPVAIKILDSFKLLTQADIDAELKRKIAAATPKPLPQEPVAKKLKSDAEDEGLKGKVKTIFSEEEDSSGTGSASKRKPSSMVYYNERGNLIKRELYDYRGNLYDITVYGYLDGERVSDSKSIEYEYDPPPMMIAPVPGQPKPKYDPRYSYKLKFEYDKKGNLKEEDWYGNSGKLWLRYVYNYNGNQKEELVYSEDGSLNQKYVYQLDDKGNEIEETSYQTQDDTSRDKYSYSYEFDAKGNWTKRTVSKWITKDGKSSFVPAWVDYRTITYY